MQLLTHVGMRFVLLTGHSWALQCCLHRKHWPCNWCCQIYRVHAPWTEAMSLPKLSRFSYVLHGHLRQERAQVMLIWAASGQSGQGAP